MSTSRIVGLFTGLMGGAYFLRLSDDWFGSRNCAAGRSPYTSSPAQFRLVIWSGRLQCFGEWVIALDRSQAKRRGNPKAALQGDSRFP